MGLQQLPAAGMGLTTRGEDVRVDPPFPSRDGHRCAAFLACVAGSAALAAATVSPD